ERLRKLSRSFHNSERAVPDQGFVWLAVGPETSMMILSGSEMEPPQPESGLPGCEKRLGNGSLFADGNSSGVRRAYNYEPGVMVKTSRRSLCGVDRFSLPSPQSPAARVAVCYMTFPRDNEHWSRTFASVRT